MDDFSVRLSTTAAQAVAGTYIDITGVTVGGTYTLNRPDLAGAPGWVWQGSNDGVTYIGYGGQGYAFTVAGSTAAIFTDVPYRYLRLKYTAGSAGGINLKATGFGKKK